MTTQTTPEQHAIDIYQKWGRAKLLVIKPNIDSFKKLAMAHFDETSGVMPYLQITIMEMAVMMLEGNLQGALSHLMTIDQASDYIEMVRSNYNVNANSASDVMTLRAPAWTNDIEIEKTECNTCGNYSSKCTGFVEHFGPPSTFPAASVLSPIVQLELACMMWVIKCVVTACEMTACYTRSDIRGGSRMYAELATDLGEFATAFTKFANTVNANAA